MTDEELRKVYDEGFEGAVVAQESQAEAFSAALRAVFRAGFAEGARAQRDMEPTAAMLRAAVEDSEGPAVYKVVSDSGLNRLEHLAGEAFLAMQRLAPLVGGEK